ncbi:uncharacterized protein BDZ99DRAFT_144446 [Mytilinidion resinicola]|uniref:Uncharacterized protein n=1 Tax=Mytilinidion resinicola TaxID=574789 RepID=A0A6A6Y8C4_9PEZI|nr:uncharacterized protein BDZ99DRAFT_144446 [Mytilinidion resinicola]KAF2804859.1 hypothetical protein BDZ99DRAFT_144446 [Mytilinidion resinicola]
MSWKVMEHQRAIIVAPHQSATRIQYKIPVHAQVSQLSPALTTQYSQRNSHSATLTKQLSKMAFSFIRSSYLVVLAAVGLRGCPQEATSANSADEPATASTTNTTESTEGANTVPASAFLSYISGCAISSYPASSCAVSSYTASSCAISSYTASLSSLSDSEATSSSTESSESSSHASRFIPPYTKPIAIKYPPGHKRYRYMRYLEADHVYWMKTQWRTRNHKDLVHHSDDTVEDYGMDKRWKDPKLHRERVIGGYRIQSEGVEDKVKDNDDKGAVETENGADCDSSLPILDEHQPNTDNNDDAASYVDEKPHQNEHGDVMPEKLSLESMAGNKKDNAIWDSKILLLDEHPPNTDNDDDTVPDFDKGLHGRARQRHLEDAVTR